mmetsp:Transcript_46669/g.129724  ORF Transcript_46669/g.129724 Transcript_46669/m.129724 type:complete len:206 (+) Transcript_46669:969-1586(+)
MKHLRRNLLERHQLELFHPVPCDDLAVAKHICNFVLVTVSTQHLKWRPALSRIGLVNQHKRLSQLETRVQLFDAVCAVEVAFTQEDENALRSVHVFVELSNVHEIVDVQEHSNAGQEELHLALHDRDLVLAGTPDMAQKQVPFPFRSQRQLRRSVGAREENEAYDVLRCHLVSCESDKEYENAEIERHHRGDQLLLRREAKDQRW